MSAGEPSQFHRHVVMSLVADLRTVLYSLYVYAPNKEAPIIFAVLYAISTAMHIWQC